MNKLHSLIDHLKDQEKGYMDLLNSFIKFQQLAGNYTESLSALGGGGGGGSLYPNNAASNKINNTNATAAPSGSEYSEAETLENNNDYASKYQKDILDLSELNESIYQQQLQQQQQQKLVATPNKAAEVNSSSSSKLNNSHGSRNRSFLNNADNSATSSMTGSFISDTLTLNGAAGAVITNDKSNILNMLKLTSNLNDDTLAIIGKALMKSSNGSKRNEMSDNEDEDKTENDQDTSVMYEETVLSKLNRLKNQSQLFEEDDDENVELNGDSVNPTATQQQRNDLMLTLDSDLNMLEQLREQKKLLRSIRLRKEELKALEGRRKALEALKKVAGNDGDEVEDDQDDADDDDGDRTKNRRKLALSVGFPDTNESVFKPFKRAAADENSVAETTPENNNTNHDEDDKLASFFELLLEKKKQRMLKEQDGTGQQLRPEVTLSAKKTPQSQPLLRKTFKHSHSSENNTLKTKDDEDESAGERQSFLSLFKKSKSDNSANSVAFIEPASQIEKSKQTVRHFEEMMHGRSKAADSSNEATAAVKKFSEDFNGLLRSIVQGEEGAHESSTRQSAQHNTTTTDTPNEEEKQELKEKLADLAESEKKLG
jgi:hypothetical protein